jgi:hypothetical protein
VYRDGHVNFLTRPTGRIRGDEQPIMISRQRPTSGTTHARLRGDGCRIGGTTATYAEMATNRGLRRRRQDIVPAAQILGP